MKRKLSKLLGIGLTIALLTSLLVTAAPAAALSQPQVSLNPVAGTIGATSTYTVTFTAGAAVPVNGQIVLIFPAGTNINNTLGGNVTIEALGGIGGGPIAAGSAVNATTAVTGTYPAAQTLTIVLTGNQTIGAGSLVGLTIKGVINPQTPGSYTVSVATKTITNIPIETAVASASYAINSPVLNALPGVVRAFNAAGIQMLQDNKIGTCIAAAGIGGRVEVGPGTYDEDVLANVAEQTIVAVGEAGTVIIKDENGLTGGGTLTVSAAGNTVTKKGVTIDGFTFAQHAVTAPQADTIKIAPGASYVTITNCTIPAGTASAINVQAAGGGNNKVVDCSIDATSTTATPGGILANSQVSITGTDIAISSIVGANGIAITSSAGVALLPTTVEDCAITGSSGIGVSVTGGTLGIKNSTFTTLYTALQATAGTTTMSGSTIDECGGTATLAMDAVTLGGTAIVKMNGNTIQNTEENNYAVNVAAGNLTANFNSFLNNAKNITDATLAGGCDAVNNWWGSASGPATGTIIGNAAYTPYLTSPPGASDVAFAKAELKTKDTIGIDVATYANGALLAPTSLAVSEYSENPELVAPTIKGTGSVLGYYDVYATGIAAGTTDVVLKFYGAVTQYTKIYYAGGLAGTWSEPNDWGVNVAGGYVYVNITNAVGSAPNFVDLAGLPFALVEDKTLSAPDITAAAGGSPTIGAYDISVTPTFTWAVVLGADHYEIALCEDPSFTIIEWAYNVDSPFFKADEALRYETTYYWRVRGVLDSASTAFTPWATGIFTTESETADGGQDIVIEPTKPEVNVEIPPTKITVEPSEPVIPTYMLWIIVVVGAILVIALIVLIVRTRRVA